MKNKLIVGLAVFFFVFAALMSADDKDKDKNKTSSTAKQTVTAKQKPAPQPQPKPSSSPQQKPAPTAQPQPSSSPQPKPNSGQQQKPKPTPQVQAPSAPQHPSPANPKQSNLGDSGQVKPSVNGRGVQPGPQNIQTAPRRNSVVHHVDTQELHRKMSVPVSRDVLIRERDHYHQVEIARFKIRGPVIRLEPRHRPVLVHLRIVPATYYHRRVVFYETYGFVPPVYIYRLRPSYGLWCATFLAFMLDRIALAHEYEYSLMYYHHMREPEFVEWRQEMDGLAAENAELREKLAALDQRVAALEGTPRDPAYIPGDAGDVALSPEVIDKFTSGTEKY
jgi:hypothetical protein